MQTDRISLCAGAAFALSGVVLGAWGAHGLAAFIGSTDLHAWETAVLYQFFHALALLITGVLAQRHPSRALNIATYLFIAGTLVFSGSLYLLMLGAPGWLGPVTPIGGTALIAGWLSLLVGVWCRSDG